MVHKIDLNAAERARQRKNKAAAVEVDWHGHTYRLPLEQPTEVGRHFRKLADYSDNGGQDGKTPLTIDVLETHYNDGLSVLFCTCTELPMPDDDHPGNPALHEASCDWRRFLGTRPSQDTKHDLITMLNDAYGASSGESRPPRRSSKTTSTRSPRTGAGSTRQTSAKRSTGGAATKKADASRRS